MRCCNVNAKDIDIYVIVIDLLVCTTHTQHETQRLEVPEGKCHVCVVSPTKWSMTLISHVAMAL